LQIIVARTWRFPRIAGGERALSGNVIPDEITGDGRGYSSC